ncbi:hypothetical protein AN958_01260 [Leucoagaricus sp. SymC.cos]|nr:hypothetical protein AN958_01260 [Leucoagaricus sp. SymC.cos]
MPSSIAQYLRSGNVIISHNPTYDDKGRQLPFQESLSQRRERHSFVKSLQWRRNVEKWMHNQRHAQSSTTDAHSSVCYCLYHRGDTDDYIRLQSTSSSESSSPRTPASPLNTPHAPGDANTPHYEKMKQQTISALDAELAKLVLASRQIAPPQHRQSRNYKNLHLPNTTASRYQPQNRPTSQLQRAQVPASMPTRGIFDSSPSYPNSVFSAYPPLHHSDVDEELDSGEPYILYSSSISSSSPSTTSTTQAAGIGEFPYPSPSSSSPRSSSHSRSISLTSPAPLISPSSSSSPRTLTSPSIPPAGSTPIVGDH